MKNLSASPLSNNASLVGQIDLFRVGGLLLNLRACDDTLKNSYFQIFK